MRYTPRPSDNAQQYALLYFPLNMLLESRMLAQSHKIPPVSKQHVGETHERGQCGIIGQYKTIRNVVLPPQDVGEQHAQHLKGAVALKVSHKRT